MNIWIVQQSSGSWDDFTTWNVVAFESKIEAEAYVEQNNATLPALKDKKREEANEFDSRYKALLEKYDLDDWQDNHPNFIKWRNDLDELMTEWGDKATEHVNLNIFFICEPVSIIFKS